MNTPLATVERLVRAINDGDLAAAAALYEPDAILVAQPGQVARGTAQVREALGGFVAMQARLTSEAEHVLEAGELALYLGRWQLRGTAPGGEPIVLSGVSSDVLRRQPDGRWLIAIDNPWGAQVLPAEGRAAASR